MTIEIPEYITDDNLEEVYDFLNFLQDNSVILRRKIEMRIRKKQLIDKNAIIVFKNFEEQRMVLFDVIINFVNNHSEIYEIRKN